MTREEAEVFLDGALAAFLVDRMALVVVHRVSS
jgi:hypothetical protein